MDPHYIPVSSPAEGYRDVCAYLTFIWVLKIWTQVLIFVRQTCCCLSHLHCLPLQILNRNYKVSLVSLEDHHFGIRVAGGDWQEQALFYSLQAVWNVQGEHTQNSIRVIEIKVLRNTDKWKFKGPGLHWMWVTMWWVQAAESYLKGSSNKSLVFLSIRRTNAFGPPYISLINSRHLCISCTEVIWRTQSYAENNACLRVISRVFLFPW